jgi:hypothetical protein
MGRGFQYILSWGVDRIILSLNIQQECIHSLIVVDKRNCRTWSVANPHVQSHSSKVRISRATIIESIFFYDIITHK